MENVREQQIEALETGIEYAKKLIPAIREIIPELQGEEKDDTKDFLNQILDGINFMIEIVNATLPLINETEDILNKDGIEEKVQLLNQALGENNNEKTAKALEEGMLPFLEIYIQVVSILLSRIKA